MLIGPLLKTRIHRVSRSAISQCARDATPPVLATVPHRVRSVRLLIAGLESTDIDGQKQTPWVVTSACNLLVDKRRRHNIVGRLQSAAMSTYPTGSSEMAHSTMGVNLSLIDQYSSPDAPYSGLCIHRRLLISIAGIRGTISFGIGMFERSQGAGGSRMHLFR